MPIISQLTPTLPGLPVSPIPPKIKPSQPPTSPDRPNLLPLAPKHMAKRTQGPLVGRLGGGVKETAIHSPQPPSSMSPGAPSRSAQQKQQVSPTSSGFVCPLFVLSSSPPVRSRSLFGIAPKQRGALSPRLHRRPKRASATKQAPHAPPTRPEKPEKPRSVGRMSPSWSRRGERSTRKQRGLPDDDQREGELAGADRRSRHRRLVAVVVVGNDVSFISSPPSRPENKCHSTTVQTCRRRSLVGSRVCNTRSATTKLNDGSTRAKKKTICQTRSPVLGAKKVTGRGG
jgi:hypothetical protein